MGVIMESVDEFLGVLVKQRMMSNAPGPSIELGFAGQFAAQDQVGGLQICALFGELLDGVATVPENPLLPVDHGNAALAGSGVGETGIISHQAKVLVRCLDLSQVHGPDGPLPDGDLVVPA